MSTSNAQALADELVGLLTPAGRSFIFFSALNRGGVCVSYRSKERTISVEEAESLRGAMVAEGSASKRSMVVLRTLFQR